ncbi:isochorismate synthase [Spirosoma sp. RP8]|uniref:isochorismate synthase n=1 Tax=Spirosoma liriopis TaxID=2937440 RepID=A0ABT0HKW3_9BACT|nr:isochorismate synthase [Spirosoma liriopis]MCK8492810.1 isochorismate synthase [Spirosoma liriopis]
MQSDSVRIEVSSTQSTERRLNPVDFWETSRALGLPAALWRLPNQQEKQLIVSFDEILPQVSADLEELPAGFLVGPFDNLNTDTATPSRTLFLRADVQARFSDDNQSFSVNNNGEIADRFQKLLTEQFDTNSTTQLAPMVPTALVDPEAEKHYTTNVAKAVEAMQRGEFRKVVLSRTKRLLFADAPNAVQLFDKLCQKYPTAFISAVSIPEKGQIWISATPERLVSVDANGIFRTNSLAGTQSAFEPDGTPKRPPEAMWSQKEIEEQALVSRYIIECFKKIRLREYQEEGPKTIIAGNLMHLATSFTVDTQAVRYPQLGTVMLRLLHPTSAVCGTPRDIAFDFINQHETHDRELYSGFVGPVNINTNNEGPASDLFVHIRCMKLEGNVATLYAGAGLTEHSVPQLEWQETEMKCQTLLSVISQQ